MSSQPILKAENHVRSVRMPKHSATRLTLSNFFGLIIILSGCELVGAQTQKKVNQAKTREQCSNLAGGSSITSIAECEQVAVRLGWSDVVVGSKDKNGWVVGDTGSWLYSPPGCYLKSGSLRYSTRTTSTISCSNTRKCACSILCPPGTFQDEDDQTTCANHVLLGSINK